MWPIPHLAWIMPIPWKRAILPNSKNTRIERIIQSFCQLFYDIWRPFNPWITALDFFLNLFCRQAGIFQQLLLIGSHRTSYNLLKSFFGRIIYPRVSITKNTDRICSENYRFAFRWFIPYRDMVIKWCISLLDPITMLVGDYMLPARNTGNTGIADNLLQLIFAAKTVANIVEVDLPVSLRFGVFD